MLTSTTSRRLSALVAASLMSVALPSAPAWAQKTKTKPEVQAQATAGVTSTSDVTVEIPTIEAVDSNLDEATLRSIFSGEIVDNADALAGLTATSITIPQIVIDAATTIDGTTSNTQVTFTDLVLSDVAEGIAASVSLAGMSVDGGVEGTGEFGALSAGNFDIGGMLGFYGLVDGGGQTELETVYTDFSFEGGTFTSPEVECAIGPMTSAEFKARPLNYTFGEMMALAERMNAEKDDPSPQTIGATLRMYADLLTAFESSPVEFGGFDCSGTDEDGKPLDFTIASMTMGGMSPGIYPAISAGGIDIVVEGDGAVSIGNISIKSMDLSGPIAVIQGAPDALDDAWFEANARSLIPAFEGFSFSDVAVDVPDPETEGGRIKASVGTFDLSLGSYLNGIPTDLLTTATNVVFDLPEDTADEQLQLLMSLGVNSIDAGFTLDAAWNEAEDTISVNEVSVTGADLATVILTGTIANATEALFSTDENQSMAAAMAVAIASLKVDITDAGLSDLILTIAAAEQGASAETMRPVFAGLAEGTVIGMLAGAAEAQKVGAAISSFVSGKAKNLTIEMTAKEAPGLGMMDFMLAEDDPTVLIGKVTIDATAK